MVNILLTIFKFIAGVQGKSSVIMADAGHSLPDLLPNIVTFWSVRISNLPADDEHPYRHERYEVFGALAISSMLCIATYGFGAPAYKTFITLLPTSSREVATAAASQQTKHIALLTAFTSITSKESSFRITASVAKCSHSQVLLANAWYHRSNALSSIISLLNI